MVQALTQRLARPNLAAALVLSVVVSAVLAFGLLSIGAVPAHADEIRSGCTASGTRPQLVHGRVRASDTVSCSTRWMRVTVTATLTSPRGRSYQASNTCYYAQRCSVTVEGAPEHGTWSNWGSARLQNANRHLIHWYGGSRTL